MARCFGVSQRAQSAGEARRGAVADERRTWPRIPTDLGVVVEAGSRRVMGVTVDASEGGLRVALREAGLAVDAEVQVRMRLPDAGWYTLNGQVVRSEEDGVGATLGIRLEPDSVEATEPPGPPTTRDGRGRKRRVRKSRAKVRPPQARERHLVMAELRALGGHVYEQCILGDEAGPSEATKAWVARLAWELGEPEPAPVDSFHDLIHVLADLHRQAAATEATPAS